MIDFAWDNDVLIKLSSYGLLAELIEVRLAENEGSSQAALGVARWVVTKALDRRASLGNAEVTARAGFEALLSGFFELEPSQDEINLAAALEEGATALGMSLDPGESLLTAICIERSCALVTGDKRAIAALQSLQGRNDRVQVVRRTVFCLEQTVGTLAAALGGDEVRSRVCKRPTVDRALTSAMECARERGGFSPDGLVSYVDDLRRTAPDILADGYTLTI